MPDSENFSSHQSSVKIHGFSSFEQLFLVSGGYLNDTGSFKDTFPEGAGYVGFYEFCVRLS